MLATLSRVIIGNNMLLGRMGAHIKKQDWFAVSLDLVVVVLGIFIALQATEWNIERLNKIEEDKYLTRLHDDFTQSINSNQDAIGAIEYWKTSHTNAIASLTNQLLIEEDTKQFETSLQSILFTLSPRMALGTIQELMSTGKLSIIQSDDVIKSVLKSQEEFTVYENLFNSMQLRTYTQANYLDGLFVVATTGDETNPMLIDYNFEELSQNRKFLLHLKNTIGKLETNKNWLENLNSQLLISQQLIENELNPKT
jgi:hypothetical protein